MNLKPHQLQVVNFKTRGLYVFHSPGSGKTLAALGAAKKLGLKTYFVVPGAVVAGVQRELLRMPVPDVHVMTYGHFIRLDPGVVKNTLVIVDEIHNFRNPGNESLHLILLCSRAQRVIVMSGTPLQNAPEDILVGATLVSDMPQIRSLSGAKTYYSEIAGAFRKSGVGILRGRLSYYKSSMSGYPKIVYRTIRVQANRKYEQEYESVENSEIKKLPSTLRGVNLNVFYNGVRRAANNISEPSPKVKEIIRMTLDCVRKHKKVVIYSIWNDSGIGVVRDKLDKRRIPYGVISGNESTQQKITHINAYNSDVIRVLLITKAGAAGIDLKGTRLLMVMEPHWNHELIKQVIARAARYQSHTHLAESKQRVTICRFVLQLKSRKSIDDVLMEMSDKKDEQIQEFYAGLRKIAL